MTTGQIIFYSGIGMLILTVILGIVFWIKRPRYTPESAADFSADGQKTQRLRNGYPTDRLTIRREHGQPVVSDTAPLCEETEHLARDRTEALPNTEALEIKRTEKLTLGTEPLTEATTPLEQGNFTVPIQTSNSQVSETELLQESGQQGQTVDISSTTPLGNKE